MNDNIKVQHLASLKSPGVVMHATQHLLPLDVNTPFGNLQLTWMIIIQRIDSANEIIDKINVDFVEMLRITQEKNPQKSALLSAMDQNIYNRQKINCELLIYLLKTIADQIISLVTLLSDRNSNGEYPNNIRIDSIGDFLNYINNQTAINANIKNIMDKHVEMLRAVNEIANCFKHSFVNAQLSLRIPSEAPGIIAYYLPHNNLNNEPHIYNIRLREIVVKVDQFLGDSKGLVAELHKGNS